VELVDDSYDIVWVGFGEEVCAAQVSCEVSRWRGWGLWFWFPSGVGAPTCARTCKGGIGCPGVRGCCLWVLFRVWGARGGGGWDCGGVP
jgi:hypothetical protein